MNTAKAVWWTRLLQVTDRVYLALCDLEVDPMWNVIECSKLKSTHASSSSWTSVQC